MAFELEFCSDAPAFLNSAGGYLSQHPVVSTVVTTVAHRQAHGSEPPQPGDWWLTVRDGSTVVGAAMRTAPFEPRPAFLLPMPDQAARELGRVLHGRGEGLEQVDGALPATRICAEELALLTGGEVEAVLHLRLFRLTRLIPPRTVPGRLRSAVRDDLDLVRACYQAFMDDADAQAGRVPGATPREAPDAQMLRRRIDAGGIWLWDDDAGTPVHLTAVNPPSFGVARIGPVYTPPEQRGRGYASAAVAEVSGRLLEAGVVPCLFTDQANPTSNQIYTALGYEPVVDMANYVVRSRAERR